jgi:hypothetical protein
MAVSSAVFSQTRRKKSGLISLEKFQDQFFVVDYLCSDSLRYIRTDPQLALIVLLIEAILA